MPLSGPFLSLSIRTCQLGFFGSNLRQQLSFLYILTGCLAFLILNFNFAVRIVRWVCFVLFVALFLMGHHTRSGNKLSAARFAREWFLTCKLGKNMSECFLNVD